MLSRIPFYQLDNYLRKPRNKDIRKFRGEFSRKCNRVKTNQDIFYRLLISSDPIITSHRSLPKRKREIIPADVLNMLLPELMSSPEEIATADDSELSSNSEDEGNWEI
ncbi:hypothetical protein JTB14_025746 [Gonioctena quinquepunctata]|nr:hypothetical protein JTB14_025746 [Gonioctena quinquepunctata]